MSIELENLVFKTFPVMHFDEYILREISAADDMLHYMEYMSHKEVRRFLSQEDIPSSLDEASRQVSYWGSLFPRRISIYWAIAEKDTNKIIGTCGYNHWNSSHRRAEISYDLAYEYWGKGIMRRALQAICKFAFQQMKVNRVQAMVVDYNHRSIKLLENLKFNREGLMKYYSILHNAKTSSYMYGLTV